MRVTLVHVAGALGALLALSAAGALAAELPADWTDRFIVGAQLVWAGPGEKAASFEETRAAMEAMLAEMHKREYRADIDKTPVLAATRAKLTAFLDACELERPKCLHIFGHLDLMLADEPDDAINLVPYLRECERRQTQFCAGGAGPNKMANFFGKIATACWSKKGERKDCKESEKSASD